MCNASESNISFLSDDTSQRLVLLCCSCQRFHVTDIKAHFISKCDSESRVLTRDSKRSKDLSETLHADPVVHLDLISDECYNILLVRSRDHSAVLRISRAMGCLITFCNLVRSHVGPWTWQSHRRTLPNGVWIHMGHKGQVLTQVILKHPPSGNKNPLECWADAWSTNTKKHRCLGKFSFLLASYFPLFLAVLWLNLDEVGFTITVAMVTERLWPSSLLTGTVMICRSILGNRKRALLERRWCNLGIENQISYWTLKQIDSLTSGTWLTWEICRIE